MVIENKQEALELIETTLQDTYDETVSTSVLLLKCQRITILLDSKNENEWIWKELEGYELDEILPKYRMITLRDYFKYAKVKGVNRDNQLLISSLLRGEEFDRYFPVIEPCNHLETVEASFPISIMRIITSSIRTRIHEFLVSQKSTLLLQPHLQGIFDDTMNLIASKLAALDPDLLEELRKIIEKLQSKSELDWRSIVDSCRTIIQRFTDVVYLEEMVPDDEEKPAHNRTKNKCRQIAVWALSQFDAKLSDSPESSRIEQLPLYLDNYYEMIIRSVEKVKHKDMRTLRKDEVDRVVIYTILWMADLIQLLSRADYSWT